MIRKVVEFNLELGSPSVEAALSKMTNALITFKGQGSKAVILIHGYGSTGVGGGIKAAVNRSLSDNSLRGIVRAFCGGEEWIVKKREFIGFCKPLENHERNISGNQGVTVVVLR